MRSNKKIRKKLTKSSTNRLIAGVLGGFAEYWHVKPNGVRIIYLVLTALTSFIPGILIYLMLARLMPNDSQSNNQWQNLARFFGINNSQTVHQPKRKELHDVEERDL